MRLILGTVPSVLLLAAAAAGQLTEKQANLEVHALAKQMKKGHAAAVQAHTATVLAALDPLAEAAPGAVDGAVEAAFTALETWQVGLFDDFRAFHDLAMDKVQLVLGDFGQGLPVFGAYPEDLFFGTGGPLDDLRADMQARQEKALAKVRKRLAKVAGKLEKATGARLAAHLELATRQGNDGFTQTAITTYTRVPLLIHTVLALGQAGQSDVGVLRVGGLGEDATAISVRALGEGGLELATADFPDAGSPAWHATLDDGGEGLAAGNWLVVAEQGSAGSSFGAWVSVR